MTEPRVVRICHVIVGLGGGGAERMLERLALAQSRKDNELVTSIVSLTDLGVLGASLRERGVSVDVLHWRGFADLPSMIWRLARLLRTLQPDVVQTWMYHADLFGGIAARLAGVKGLVWGIRTTHLPDNAPWSTRFARRACALLSSQLPDVIVCNASVARDVHVDLGYSPNKMRVVPNGFDTARFSATGEGVSELREQWRAAIGAGAGDERIFVGMVGRDSPDKDPGNFITAMQIVLRGNPQVVALMIGKGFSRLNADLVNRLEADGIAERFLLLDQTENIVPSMAALDLFVLPSRTEAFPNVVAEAMLMSKVCVVTDVGDARNIVGEFGFVVPPADPHALAQGIETALTRSESDRMEIGKSARQRICQEFSLESVSIRFSDVYRSLLSAVHEKLGP